MLKFNNYSDKVTCWETIFASFVVVEDHRIPFLDIRVGIKKDSSSAIKLAPHGPHILLLSLRVLLVIVNSTEKSTDVCVVDWDNYKAGLWVASAEQLHNRIVLVEVSLLIGPDLATVLC